jgi:hypothetical protein
MILSMSSWTNIISVFTHINTRLIYYLTLHDSKLIEFSLEKDYTDHFISKSLIYVLAQAVSYYLTNILFVERESTLIR